MGKAKIVFIISIILLISLGLGYYIVTKEDKPKAVSKLEQYQKELKEASDKNLSIEQGNVPSDNKALKEKNDKISEKKTSSTREPDDRDDPKGLEKKKNIEKAGSDTYEEITDKQKSVKNNSTSDSKYHYSTDLYFDTNKNYDEQTKATMTKFNNLADEIENKGIKQASLDYGKLTDPSVKYISENTYFNPEDRHPFIGLYEVSNLNAIYYVNPEWYYEGMGTHEWELVLNNFFEAIVAYYSVKEAKKFVDTELAYKCAEPGEDVLKHTKYTDPCISNMLLHASTVLEAHPKAVFASGTYVIKSIGQFGDMIMATVSPVFLWHYYEEVYTQQKLEPDKTYLSEYQVDESTGKAYKLRVDGKKLVFNICMTTDEYGNWKIACIEPLQ